MLPYKLVAGVTSDKLGNQSNLLMLRRLILKVTKFQLPRPKRLSTVVKNILPPPPPMSNRVKDGVKCIDHVLSSVFNKSMESGVFPDNLKIATICPIYKGEGSKSSPNNCRPILVLPIVARLFEKSFTLRTGFTSINLAFVQSIQQKLHF